MKYFHHKIIDSFHKYLLYCFNHVEYRSVSFIEADEFNSVHVYKPCCAIENVQMFKHPNSLDIHMVSVVIIINRVPLQNQFFLGVSKADRKTRVEKG